MEVFLRKVNKMGKHTILGWSTVAKSWRKAYSLGKVGDPISVVINIAGKPDTTLNLGDSLLMTWESSEWKGFLRGGTRTRKMVFVVKNNVIFSKSSEGLGAWSI